MYYPKTVKSNMRHRGPVETFKLNRNNIDTADDIARLYYKVGQLAAELTKYREAVYAGTEKIEGLGTYAARLDRTTMKIKDLKRGVENV